MPHSHQSLYFLQYKENKTTLTMNLTLTTVHKTKKTNKLYYITLFIFYNLIQFVHFFYILTVNATT